VQGGSGRAIDDLTAAPASFFSSFDDLTDLGVTPKTWQITEPIYDGSAIDQILLR